MSDPLSKVKTSKRRYNTETVAKRQFRIAKEHGMNPDPDELHKFAKHHAMDCGNPECHLCGNPRHSKLFKTKDKLTTQERRFYQDVENSPNRHGRGFFPENEEND